MPDETTPPAAPGSDAWLSEPLRADASTAPGALEVAALRNKGLETVDACAKRMLADHQGDRREKITAREAARLTAEGVARSWRQVGDEKMSMFYSAVATFFSEG